MAEIELDQLLESTGLEKKDIEDLFEKIAEAEENPSLDSEEFISYNSEIEASECLNGEPSELTGALEGLKVLLQNSEEAQ